MDTKSTSIIGVVVLGILVAGGVLWYMSEHPAPVTFEHGGTGIGTSTEQTLPQKIEEHAKYYDITASSPSVTSLKATAGAQADAQAVEVMKQFVTTSVAGFKDRGNFANLTAKDIEMMGFDQGRKEAFEVKYTTQTGPRAVSYIFTLFEDTFGAHPNTYYRTFTFDTKTGEGLELGDLFTPGTDYLSVLSKVSRDKLPSQLAKASNAPASSIDMEYLKRGTSADADNFTTWFIQGGNLVLKFPPYQVAAYVFGAPELSIPLSSLPIKALYK
jgi:Protein of unknown function (DUF3298)